MSTAVSERRQDADAARGRRLHEREWRERERRNVEGPAGETDDKADPPRAVAEEQAQRLNGSTSRQRGQLLRRTVLLEPAPIECEGGEQRERKPRADAHL